MPYVSRLKSLGTLSVPELNTTLAVYLINLDGSEETNLVYAANDPIASDASPPAHLRFTSPDGQTKRGDVLLWASLIKRRGPCIVHGCWVFDGTAWVPLNLHSQVKMEHPEHSEYQLEVSSGPYVKWELKPDPDHLPSLSVPDPPRIRSNVQAAQAVNTSPTTTRRESRSATIRTRAQSEYRRNELLRATESTTPTSISCEAQSSSRLDLSAEKSHHISEPNQATSEDVPQPPSRVDDNPKSHKTTPEIIHTKRHRYSSPDPSSHKKRKTSDNWDESGQNSTNLDLLLHNLEAAMYNQDDSPLAIVSTSSSQPEGEKIKARGAGHRVRVSLWRAISAVKKREKAVDLRHKALCVAYTRHSGQVAQLNQDLDNQKTRVFKLEASLRATQEDLAAQETRAKEGEDASQRELDLAVKKLRKKEQREIRLADEVAAVKQRVEELQRTLAGSKDALRSKTCELESMQADYSKLKDAHASDTQELSDELSSCKSALKESRQDVVEKQKISERDIEELRRRTADLTGDLEASYAETASIKALSLNQCEKLQETLRAIETRLEQDTSKLREQLAEDRMERKRIEREHEALERETREQGRLLEEAQARCLRLTADSSSEREKHVAEISRKEAMHKERMKSIIQQLEEVGTKHATALLDLATLRQEAQDALANNKCLEKELKDGQSLLAIKDSEKKSLQDQHVRELRHRTTDLFRMLEASRAEAASLKEMSVKQRVKLQETLRATETRLEQETSKLRELLAEDRRERERIEREREALERETREQGRLHEEAQATCLRLTADSSSEREKHAAELSQKEAMHEERMKSVVQELKEVNSKHATSLLDLATLRQVAQDALANNASLEKELKDYQSLLAVRDSEEKSLQDQHAEALESERWRRKEAEKLLDVVRQECREPFVIPTLLDCFVSAHKEAMIMSGVEGRTSS